MQEKIYKLLPHFLQNTLVTLFDYLQYRKRHGGHYKEFFHQFTHSKFLSLQELKSIQKEKLVQFLQFAKTNSEYYSKLLADIDVNDIEQYHRIPISTKEDIRSNINRIYTVSTRDAILSKTGGTTGKSLEVRFTPEDMQERFALLDAFRYEWGYQLGQKVAWFSGKSLLTSKDIVKNRYWKFDFLYKIRYYSTFHISHQTAKHYIDDLNRFQPPFAVGFPSSMVELAKWGKANNYPLNYRLKALFPTAETIVPDEKALLEDFFGGAVVNQYASSEGAPFIIECQHRNLHIELQSGWFEVLDKNNQATHSGRLVFTSFTTHGTPLIRYDIQDWLTLSDEKCTCGNQNPLAVSIEGRINDFIYSEERGKINLGNVSNCVKYVHGVVKFQIEQFAVDRILVRVVKSEEYTDKDEAMFRKELIERLGTKLQIDFEYPPYISNEASGKYRIVKQHLKI